MRRSERGNSVIETAMWMPFIMLLLVGMVQIGKVTYVYYTLKKNLYGAATFLATQQGVDFCDEGNALIAAAKEYALSGTTDGSAAPMIPNLTSDMIQVQTECIDPTTQAVGPCSSAGCGTAAGGVRPDFVIVSIPDGYQVAPRFPYMLVDPIPLKPEVRVPFGGT